jgi:hypothetical protein
MVRHRYASLSRELIAATLAVSSVPAFATSRFFAFKLVRNGALPSACPPNASAHVQIHDAGPVQVMTVQVKGLPPNTDFDFFVIQVPTAPFEMSWYQGDIETNAKGSGHGIFIGRFSIEISSSRSV